MSETGAKPGRRRIWKYFLWLMLAGGVILAGLGWYSTTESFRTMVRQRLIATLERATGGRVELGSIHVVPFHLQIEVRDRIEVTADISSEEAEKLAMSSEVVQAQLAGAQPRNVIVRVPKLVNIVL